MFFNYGLDSGNMDSPRESVQSFASFTTSPSPTILEVALPLWAHTPEADINYFQNGVSSSLLVGNICPGWEEPQEITLEEGEMGRTAKISPMGSLDAQNKGANQETLESGSNEPKQREPVSLGKNLT